MTRMKEYLDAIRANLRHLPAGQRQTVLGEIRQHLDESVSAMMAEGASRDEAEEAAIDRFGAPDDIGVAYGPEGGVVLRSTGERVLHIAKLTGAAAGRGAATAIKWTGIFILSVLAMVTVLGVAALFFADSIVDRFEDDIRESVPRPLYYFSDSWNISEAQYGLREEAFQVSADTKEMRLTVAVDPQFGCAAVQLVLPDGTTTDVNGDGCSTTERLVTYTEAGTYRVQYRYAAYAGDITVQAFGFESSPAA